uniref:Trihelix transcription factor GTL2-like n=1 Tax=Rhizophora mucronata TaxID=61149 RepID=A0A2P2NK87_RHIMU
MGGRRLVTQQCACVKVRKMWFKCQTLALSTNFPNFALEIVDSY